MDYLYNSPRHHPEVPRGGKAKKGGLARRGEQGRGERGDILLIADKVECPPFSLRQDLNGLIPFLCLPFLCLS